MVNEQEPAATIDQQPTDDDAWNPPPRPVVRKPSERRVLEILVGATVSFAALSLLYGVNQAVTLVGLLVICTAGIGLIPIVFVSWLVGWVLFAVRDGLKARSPAAVQ